MKIEFEGMGKWSAAMVSVALYGKVDGEYFRLAFSGKALSELFGVDEEPYVLQSAFRRNEEFMEAIAREFIEAGRLEYDNTILFMKDDLRPYFERRAATSPV